MALTIRRSLLGSFISLLTFVLLAVGAVSASAYEDPTWWDEKAQLEKETIMDFFYRMGPQGVTPYPGEPAAQAAETYAALPTGFSNDPSERDLTRQALEGLIGLGLVQTPRPAIIRVKPVAPVPPGGGGAGPAIITFGLSYLIGTELNGRFFHIGLDDGSVTTDHEPGEFCFTQACAPILYWYNHGETVYYGATVQQSPGAYLYSATLNGSRYTPVRWFQSPCKFSGFGGPPGASLTAVSAGVNCKYGYQQYAPVTVEYPYRTNEDLLREVPRPYVPERDGQPDITLPAPADPGIGTAETRAEAQLEGNKPLLRAWLDWRADPDRVPYENPLIRPQPGSPGQGFDRNNQCNPALFGFPRYTSRRKPGYSGHLPSAIKATYPAVPRPDVGLETVYLRYGETATPFGGGWGYRHIAYKHGWGPGDAADTAATLEAPTRIDQQSPTKFRYERDYTGAEGAACARTVVVEFNDDSDDGVDGPKYVLTSFIVGP